MVALPLNTQPPDMTEGSGVPPGGLTALPEMGTLCAPVPSFELIAYCPVKLPATVGVKVTWIWIASSGASTCPSGSGVATTNGSAGGAALVMVTLRLPVFDTVSVWVVPTGTSPKSRLDGVGQKPGLVAEPCSEVPTVAVVPPSVRVNLRAPVVEPGVVGVNETGTLIFSPALRVTGSAGGVVPNGALVLIAVTVTGRAAVATTVAVPVSPTARLPKLTCGAVSAAAAGWPKPKTLPSRVPT